MINRSTMTNRNTLCAWPHPYREPADYQETFMRAMKEIIQWHQERSPFYAQLLKSQTFNVASWTGPLAEIPFIPADFFKQHIIKSVPDSEITVHLTSSGTTGQKSQIFFDSESLGSAQKMVDHIFDTYHWKSEQKVNYLLYSYEPEEGSKLGTAFTDNFLTKYAPINKVVYALKWNGKTGPSTINKHDFDLYGCLRALQDFEKEGLPVRIFGFPAFFYFTIQRMLDLKMPPLRLSPNSFVFLGGGWKSHANQALDKTQFYQLAQAQLGIPLDRLRDGFGSVEHCIPYIECRNHHFHIPVWSQVIIRDLRTLQPLDYNQSGFLQFISPYITSVPAHSILMGDLAIKQKGQLCSCGLGTDWFEILGRAGLTKNKSCAIAAAELLKSFS
jgi:phenylacetate-coenzyme A ligase PaaK-like adenylate-forming protein